MQGFLILSNRYRFLRFYRTTSSYKQKKRASNWSPLFFKLARPGGLEPPTFWSVVKRSIQLIYERKITLAWRSGRDSNSRPPQWQCGILTNWTTGPFWLREKDLNQRPPGYEPGELPDCSTPRYYTNNKNGASGRDWTADTRIFSPVLYRLSYRSIVAEKEGFEPPRGFLPLSVFKTDPFSRTWVFLRVTISIILLIYKNGGPSRTRTYDRPVMSR